MWGCGFRGRRDRFGIKRNHFGLGGIIEVPVNMFCVLTHPNLGAYERSRVGFVKYDTDSFHDKWRTARAIPDEKVCDTHKLACLGLPDGEIRL